MTHETRKALLSPRALLVAQTLILFISLRSVVSKVVLPETWRNPEPFQQVQPFVLDQTRLRKFTEHFSSSAGANDVKFARAWEALDWLCGGDGGRRFICRSYLCEYQKRMLDHLVMVDRRVRELSNSRDVENPIKPVFDVEEAHRMIKWFCQSHSLLCWSVLWSQKPRGRLSQC